jgi:thiol peroxidase
LKDKRNYLQNQVERAMIFVYIFWNGRNFFMASITFKGNPVTLLGQEVKVGDTAPNFTVLANDLSPVTLADSKGKVRLISVVPSIDTGVCDAQTRRFNEEAAKLDNVQILTVSVDLPFAQKRWCASAGIDKVQTVSDHRDLSFGEAFGVAIQELRLLARAVFVIDSNDKVTYVEYVSEATDHPNYEAAVEAAKAAQ